MFTCTAIANVGQSKVVNSIATAPDFTTDVSKLTIEMHVMIVTRKICKALVSILSEVETFNHFI